MGVIRRVGRPSTETRVLTALVYALLVGGGITMIYPFLIMISGSFKSEVDLRTYDIVPAFWHDRAVLYRKYLESRYNESVAVHNLAVRDDVFSFRHAEPPGASAPARVEDWRRFRREVRLPLHWNVLADSSSSGNRMLPRLARAYRAWMVDRCEGSLARFHADYGGLVTSWMGVSFPIQAPGRRAFKHTGTPLEKAQDEFKAGRPARDLIPVSLDGSFVDEYLELKYGKDVAALNEAYGAKYADYDSVFLARKPPREGARRADWLEFVRRDVNLQFIVVERAAGGEWAAFLAERYAGSLKTLNRNYGARFGSFAEVPYPEDRLTVGHPLVDWELFVQRVSPGHLALDSPEFRWRDYLRRRYGGDLGKLSAAHGLGYPSFDRIAMPLKQVDWAEVNERPFAWRWEFSVRNYRHVVEYFFQHGRGVWNTFVFCLLSVLAALVVNPVAAYAMSRFGLPSTYKVLLFLLATMAFPPMVTAIPNFLLLKELGMLNTFWALVLPGVVNGYAIFLLKGFFDSQPRELYEAAQIDGAGEWTMFWRLTMNLSKPILAVIALGAFNAAYGAFIFAFIVCQDEKMWTLMVWLYQLQQYSHQSVVFAALLVASIPTFAVFVLCQNLIMRGIVVPVEK